MSSCKRQKYYARSRRAKQTWSSHDNAFCNIRFQTRISQRTWHHKTTTITQPLHYDLQPESQETHSNTHTWTTTHCRTQRRNRFVLGSTPEPLYPKKHKVSCPGFPPKRSPCNIHAAITMRFATSGSKPASLNAHGNTKRQQPCSHYTAICNHYGVSFGLVIIFKFDSALSAKSQNGTYTNLANVTKSDTWSIFPSTLKTIFLSFRFLCGQCLSSILFTLGPEGWYLAKQVQRSHMVRACCWYSFLWQRRCATHPESTKNSAGCTERFSPSWPHRFGYVTVWNGIGRYGVGMGTVWGWYGVGMGTVWGRYGDGMGMVWGWYGEWYGEGMGSIQGTRLGGIMECE